MKREHKNVNLKEFKMQYSAWDIAAFAVFLIMAVWYIFVIPRGINVADESFYYTIPNRLMQGDRLFVDEWQVSQLSSLFQYLPYRLFVLISGSNAGVMVFMRAFAVCVALFMFWFVYTQMRGYRIWGIIAAFMAGMFFPGGVLALSYYTVSIYAMLSVSLLLFLNKTEHSRVRLFCVGLLLSCAVLAQPLLVFLYILFSVLCLVRTIKPQCLKSFDFVINAKSWKWITLSCAITFVIVVGTIAAKSGAQNMMRTIPELFTDAEYDLSFGGNQMKNMLLKLANAFDFYGAIFMAGSVIVCIVAGLNRFLWKRKNLKVYLLVAASVLLLAEIICAMYATIRVANAMINPNVIFFRYAFYTFFPLSIFALSCYLLLETKQPRFFAFWATGFGISALIAFGSDAMLAYGGLISNITLLLSLRQLRHEIIYSDMKPVNKKKTSYLKKPLSKKSKAVLQAAMITGVAFIIFWSAFNAYPEGIQNYVENIGSRFQERGALTKTIAAGPYKGIKTSECVFAAHQNILSDLDEMARDSEGKPFYVTGNCSFYYLYLNQPVGTYSAWYVDADSETRQLRYWELHPEKRPAYIYIPLYADSLNFSKTWEEEKERMDKKLAFIQSIASGSYKRGKAGYIVKITEWK